MLLAALQFAGKNGVLWYEPKSEFPYVGGIVPIVVSWFLSPLLAALITLILFLVIRTLVLRRANSTKIAFWVLPILMLLTFFINLFFILVGTLYAGDGAFAAGCRMLHHMWRCAVHKPVSVAHTAAAGLPCLRLPSLPCADQGCARDRKD